MSTSTSKKRGPFWRTAAFFALVVVLAVLMLHQLTDAIGTLERQSYDSGSTGTSTARRPSDRIAIIAIDDQSVANIGRWPWPRDVHARLIDPLAAAKAKTIVYTTFFFQPPTDRGLAFIRRINLALGKRPEPRYQNDEQFAADLRSVQGPAGGYDAPDRSRAGASETFSDTSVIGRPAVLPGPVAADDQTDLEA